MSETPNNRAGEMTERIMAQIREHLKGGTEPERERTHHYNRAYEAVYDVLERYGLGDKPGYITPAGERTNERCSKLKASSGSFGRCTLVKGHEGKCCR